jgi:hypothetical protein
MINHRIHFIRDQKMFPIACIAFHDQYDISGKYGTINYAFSVTHPKDNFDRKLARQIAIGRLVENPRKIEIPVGDELPNLNGIINEIMTDLSWGKDNVPKRIMKRAWQIASGA